MLRGSVRLGSVPARATVTVAAPSTAKSTALVIPPNGAVKVGTGTSDAAVTLTNIKYRLVPSQIVPVTLHFQNAGAVTVPLPVKLLAGQTGGETVDVTPTTVAGIRG